MPDTSLCRRVIQYQNPDVGFPSSLSCGVTFVQRPLGPDSWSDFSTVTVMSVMTPLEILIFRHMVSICKSTLLAPLQTLPRYFQSAFTGMIPLGNASRQADSHFPWYEPRLPKLVSPSASAIRVGDCFRIPSNMNHVIPASCGNSCISKTVDQSHFYRTCRWGPETSRCTTYSSKTVQRFSQRLGVSTRGFRIRPAITLVRIILEIPHMVQPFTTD